jgi:cytochrome c553
MSRGSRARRTAPLLFVGVFLACAGVPAQELNPATGIAARVQGCATCHGKAGEGTKDENFPRIAGKPAGYLFNQLQAFREGRRSYPPMNYLLGYLHDDYFSEMAAFFASQRVPAVAPERPRSAAELASGERLVRQGAPASGIPPCVACHGPTLTGINPGIPGLIGLHSRYLSLQLEAWRAGTRHATAPDCMHDIAERLTEAQIGAVAAYLAAQSLPAAPAAAAPGSWKTPLSCGSQP